jgi:hypothetical protein
VRCAGGGKRQRGPAWIPAVADVTPLPAGVDAGQLAYVLELAAVFATL